MRRMIVLTVQTGGRFKAAVLLSMRVCQWRLATFNMVFITKGDGIKYVVRNGTDTFYIFCLPD